ncbi:hypothetical protein KFL_005300020 [Klebsormidium nitens]|uniref:Uncharacterized protein n=1 Tax=Klebsormidium nitens TaxID=105231 RepID=A0A1Y1IN02_KLENI|nr:hypothetical protein KFL_005300020 [Klebsormidium nitens]|eukprot:GAQ89498.1 hypothetical protein KFL_005300020 [Klebsormidium nitens]
MSSLLPSWTDPRSPVTLTNNTSRQSSPETKTPLASRASSKPAPASSWSLLHPKTWLQGLSPFEAVSLLTSEARVILTPVRNARFVVSLTTSPKRVGFLEPVLTSLLQNSLKPDVIIVNLPFVFLRDGSIFGELPKFLTSAPGVLVNRCEDVGPATKILGALPLARGPDDVIIAVDDDIWYPRHHLKKLYLKSGEDRADQKSKGNRENYAICRKFLESEALLFPGFPDTSSVYFDRAAFPSQREAAIQEALFNQSV